MEASQKLVSSRLVVLWNPGKIKKPRTPRLSSLHLRPLLHTTIIIINSLSKNKQTNKKTAFKKTAVATSRQGVQDYTCTPDEREHHERFFWNAQMEAVGVSVHRATSVEVSQTLFQPNYWESTLGNNWLHGLNSCLSSMESSCCY